jgi:hypothetical protein
MKLVPGFLVPAFLVVGAPALLAQRSVEPSAVPTGGKVANWSAPNFWAAPARLSRGDVEVDLIEPMSAEGLGTVPMPFVALPPCRVVDTRNAAGPYGGPALVGLAAARTFNIPGGPCPGIPADAGAFSINVAAILPAGDGFMTVFPTGTPQPTASDLNFLGGETIANALIVPAGAGGSIDVFVNVTTNMILDINGYYRPGDLDGTYVNESQSNSITSAMIVDGTIVNADINAAAAIADSKLATIQLAGKVADTALSANVTKLGNSIESSEITDVTRSVSIPLTSFIDCQTDVHRPLDFTSEADTIPNLTSNPTDGMGTTILFDADPGNEDQDSEICANLSLPADWVSGGVFRVRAAKGVPPSGDTEVLTCGVSLNLGALQAPGMTEIPFAGNISYLCAPTIVGLSANSSINFYLSITSSGTMNEQVRILSVAFQYTASQ